LLAFLPCADTIYPSNTVSPLFLHVMWACLPNALNNIGDFSLHFSFWGNCLHSHKPTAGKQNLNPVESQVRKTWLTEPLGLSWGAGLASFSEACALIWRNSPVCHLPCPPWCHSCGGAASTSSIFFWEVMTGLWSAPWHGCDCQCTMQCSLCPENWLQSPREAHYHIDIAAMSKVCWMWVSCCAWWHIPEISAPQEVETGESRPAWAKVSEPLFQK
jgi:hypothetical protein